MNLKKCLTPIMGLLIIGALCACTLDSTTSDQSDVKKSEAGVGDTKTADPGAVPSKTEENKADSSKDSSFSEQNLIEKPDYDITDAPQPSQTEKVKPDTDPLETETGSKTEKEEPAKAEKTDKTNSETASEEKPSPTGAGESEKALEKTHIEDGRAQARENTFLEMLPEVTFGAFSHTEKTESFDYETYSGVLTADFEEYIELVTDAGYGEVSRTEEDRTFYFEGESSSGWHVSVVYIEADNWLCIGSGYITEEKESPEALKERLFTETILSNLPIPAEGQVENYSSDDSAGSYVVLENVSEEYARAYVELIQASGFVNDIDSGDIDGFLWYMASTDSGISCNFQYWDGIVKLVCEYSEE